MQTTDHINKNISSVDICPSYYLLGEFFNNLDQHRKLMDTEEMKENISLKNFDWMSQVLSMKIKILNYSSEEEATKNHDKKHLQFLDRGGFMAGRETTVRSRKKNNINQYS